MAGWERGKGTALHTRSPSPAHVVVKDVLHCFMVGRLFLSPPQMWLAVSPNDLLTDMPFEP